MKRSRLIWILVIFLVTVTIAVTLDTSQAGSNKKSTVQPAHPEATPPNIDSILSKYGIADYDSVQSLTAPERELRSVISGRYDNQEWVVKVPHPETARITRVIDEELPVMPVEMSELIVSGKVVSAAAYMSNDKRGVYSEFKVKIDQILKNNSALEKERPEFITVDRAGGVVRYPDNQLVLYQDSIKGLPEVGGEYVLFLKSGANKDNFPVLTVFGLQEGRTVPLDDRGRPSLESIKRLGKFDFIRAVREKVALSGGGSRGNSEK
jgi:hypothetical protein